MVKYRKSNTKAISKVGLRKYGSDAVQTLKKYFTN